MATPHIPIKWIFLASIVITYFAVACMHGRGAGSRVLLLHKFKQIALRAITILMIIVFQLFLQH